MDAQTENISDTTPTGSPASKRVKPLFDIISESLSTRFFENHIGTKPIAPGKSITLKLLTACGAKELIDAMGMRSFQIDLPKMYYPDLVRQFYANLDKDEFGNLTTMVNEKRL